MRKKILLFVVLAAAVVCRSGEGRIKLVALPDRDSAVVRLDNPFATFVEEERILLLQEGVNKVDFSWRGVSLDPNSIILKIISGPEDTALLSVSYPPGEDALVWEIYSPVPAEAGIRVSYILHGIDRLVTYTFLADSEEKALGMRSFIVLRNFSGEDFAEALFSMDYGDSFSSSISHEETKQRLFLKREDIPVEKVFTFDAGLLPWDPSREDSNVGIPITYKIRNDRASGLGEFSLWGGKARVFQEDGGGTTVFLGEDNLPFIPSGGEAQLLIGESRDIVVTQHKIRDGRKNIRRNDDNRIILYDTDEAIRVKIQNFRDEPTVLNLIQRIPGYWEMEQTTHEYEKQDANTIKFLVQIPSQGVETVIFNYSRRNVR